MATLHQPALEPASSQPPLQTAGGQPVSIVHVTAEYYPYARTGGLAEAVSALAAVTALPRLVPGPTLLHAHDWHTALALVYLRTALAERYSSAVTGVLSV